MSLVLCSWPPLTRTPLVRRCCGQSCSVWPGCSSVLRSLGSRRSGIGLQRHRLLFPLCPSEQPGQEMHPPGSMSAAQLLCQSELRVCECLLLLTFMELFNGVYSIRALLSRKCSNHVCLKSWTCVRAVRQWLWLTTSGLMLTVIPAHSSNSKPV